MDLSTTLTVLAVSAAIFAFANWRARRPYEPGRLFVIPYTAIQAMALVAMLVMLGHLISLLTGQPFKGRMG